MVLTLLSILGPVFESLHMMILIAVGTGVLQNPPPQGRVIILLLLY